MSENSVTYSMKALGKEFKLCCLCHRSCESQSPMINRAYRKMMTILLLKCNLENKDLATCNKCVKNLNFCYEFKSSLLSSHVDFESIANYNKGETCVLIEEKNYNGFDDNNTRENVKCHICKTRVYSGLFIQEDNKSDVMMCLFLKQYFPELGINTSQGISICNSCNKSLKVYFDIIKSWSFPQKIKEEDIMERASQEADVKHHKYSIEIDTPSVVELDVSESYSIKHEEIDIKIDEDDFNRIEETNTMSSLLKNTYENDLEIGFYIDEAEAGVRKEQYKLDLHSIEENHTHEPMTFNEADYETNLNKHQDECTDQKTVDKQFVKHQDLSQVTIYECDQCEYKTTLKYSLKRHSVIHQDSSEVILYQCEMCKFKTRYKTVLKRHSLIHQGFKESPLYKCEVCEYKTNRKGSLMKQLLVHQDFSEGRIHHCNKCEFKTRHKNNLNRHILVHQNPSEVRFHHCKKCEYKTKHKNALKRHFVIHQDSSEVIMYQCEKCDYKTKLRDSLKRHLFIHQDASRLSMHYCMKCDFRTSHRGDFKKHSKIHHSSSEASVYQCDKCEYKTNRKVDLKKHSVIHLDASEVRIYQCDKCKFKSRHKDSLKRHLYIHQHPSEVTMYQCDKCDHKTKYKRNLKSHFATHLNSSNITPV